MRYITMALFAIIIFLEGASFGVTIIVGPLTEDQNWTAEHSPYIVVGSVELQEGLSLTIGPGVTVKFEVGAGLFIPYSSCSIDVQGTISAPVLFTSNAVSPAPEDYWGLYLGGTDSNAATLSHCVIEYATYGLILEQASVSANNVEIRRCREGIQVSYFIIDDIAEFTIHDNTSCGISGSFMAAGLIRDCEIYDNGGPGIAALGEWNSVVVEDCVVRNNAGKGISVNERVANCLVENNAAAGIVTYAEVTGCIVENNGGNGLNLLHGATATDCTIVGNAGYGVYVREVQPAQSIHVTWSRIYGNGAYDFVVDPSCLPPVIDATHNYWGTVDEEEIAERILDTHDDPSLPSEVVFIPFETAVGVDNIVPNRAAIMSCYPSPFNPQTTVTFSLYEHQRAKVAIYDLTGKQIAVLTDRIYETGDHSVIWYGKDSANRAVPSGTYIVRLETETEVQARKVMLLR